MPKCAQCGKPADTRRSFNWMGGVAYLCSEECEKESESWRLARYRTKERLKKDVKP